MRRFALIFLAAVGAPAMAVAQSDGPYQYPTTRMHRSNPWYETDRSSALQRHAPRLAVDEHFCDESPCEKRRGGGLFDGWRIDIGTIGLERRSPKQHGFFYSQGTGESLFASGDLNMGFDFGPLVRVDRNIGGCWSVESVVYAMNAWDYQFRTITPLSGRDAYDQPYTATSAALDYGSHLYNVEVNLRRTVGEHWSILCGYRWMEMHDGGFIALGSVTPSSGPALGDMVQHFNATNTLNGFQMGLEHRGSSWLGLHLESDLKVGVYDNMARASLNIDSTLGGASSARMKDKHTGFVGETAVRLVWQPLECLGGFIGYEVLWVDPGVMAVDQLYGQTAGSERVFFNDTAIYHGARAGLTARW